MKYLNKSNKPKRITTKKLQAYKKAKEQGLSANDAYNKDVLGISSVEYHWIGTAMYELYGIVGTPAPNTLTQINKWLENGGQQYDEDGNLLSYLGKLYRV